MSSGDELLGLPVGVPGLEMAEAGRQFKWYMFRSGISYVPGWERTCSRISWYEEPVAV